MNKVSLFLKNIKLSRTTLIIGCANWIVVALILMVPSTKVTIKGIPYAIEELMGIYLFYSFVPALISLALTFKVKKGDKIFNVAINIMFLWVYIIVFLFCRNMMMNG